MRAARQERNSLELRAGRLMAAERSLLRSNTVPVLRELLRSV